jgi:hypothetical protein
MGIFRRLIPIDGNGGGGGAAPFIFTVSVTAGQTFSLPLVNFGSFTPDIEVDFGDGTAVVPITSITDAGRTHVYVSAGTYDIAIAGSMPGFKVNNNASIRSSIVAIVDFGRVGLRTLDFFGCSNITTIPASTTMAAGYLGLGNIVQLAGFMRGTGVISIPSDLFTACRTATTFSDIFSFTAITTIPSGLFDNCISATSFASAFNSCTQLSSYSANLFNNSPNVINFSSCFRNCSALTSVQQFTANTSVTTFDNVYNMASTTNSLAGSAPTIWNRSPVPSGTAAFRNCTGLANFATIPSNFK